MKDKLEVILDMNHSRIRKTFGGRMKCPRCNIHGAQQLLTSFLCANYQCDNYDADYFAHALKDHLRVEIKKPEGATILFDDIKVIPRDNFQFDITVPFVVD
jgi:hypothetical protein